MFLSEGGGPGRNSLRIPAYAGMTHAQPTSDSPFQLEGLASACITCTNSSALAAICGHRAQRKRLQRARRPFHRHHILYLHALRRGLELAQLARRDEHAGFQRGDRAVVGVDRLVESAADVAPVPGEAGDARVKLTPQI